MPAPAMWCSAPIRAFRRPSTSRRDADLIIQGAAAYDFSGVSVSGAGDVNGDGIDDLIIGAPRADPNGRDRAGASYVVFGTDQGFPAIIDLATDADLIIQGAAADDDSGCSVSGAGDVNGDGIDDLIIGAPVPTRTAVTCRRQLRGVRHRSRLSGDHRPRERRRPDHPGRRGDDFPALGERGGRRQWRRHRRSDHRRPLPTRTAVTVPAPATWCSARRRSGGGDRGSDRRRRGGGSPARIEKILTKTLSKALDNLNKGRERRAIIPRPSTSPPTPT